ncbi:MAG: GNA1162 family protein [Candidatus Scalindua sp.]
MKKYAILFLLLTGCVTTGKSIEVNVNNDFPHNEVQKIAIVTFDTSPKGKGTTGHILKSVSVGEAKTIFTGIMASELRKWERFAILEGKALEEELRSRNLREADFLHAKDYSDLGQSLGVDAIVVGEIEKYGFSYITLPAGRLVIMQTSVVSFKVTCIDVITNKTIWTINIKGTSGKDIERVLASELITKAIKTLQSKLNQK